MNRPEAFPPPAFLRGEARDSDATLRKQAEAWPTTYLGIVKLNLSPTTVWGLFIPHWLIFLAVALPWTALLFWRARRRRKVL